MQQKQATINQFGNVYLLSVNKQADSEVKAMSEVFQACEDQINSLFSNEKVKELLNDNELELIKIIIDRNDTFKNGELDGDKIYCFNIVALNELALSLAKNDKIPEGFPFTDNIAATIVSIVHVVAILNKVKLFPSMGLSLYKNMQCVSIKMAKENNMEAKENLLNTKMFLALFLAYVVESKRLMHITKDRFHILLDGLELQTELDISLLPEDIKMFNEMIPNILKEDFADIYKFGEVITSANYNGEVTQELQGRVLLCTQIAILRSIFAELQKFVDQNFASQNAKN